MDVTRVIRTHITTSDLDPSQELVTSINEGKTPLLDIVKALGEYLTSTEDDVRLQGLTFLTNLVKLISPNRINRQATTTLTRFYLSKLDDFHALPPSLQALNILSKLSSFDDELAVQVYRAICEEVNMRAYVQATRHFVYVLFDSFLANHRQAFKALGADFVNSYTKMVDGEKDPRNLLLLFSMDRIILLEFEVKDHIEDIFDITFCYFPITFKPPPNDPYGITADDLKVALRGCMSASPYFAKMALPLFLEKFATASGLGMRDLMLSMAACFPVYGAEPVRERGTELWEGIKTEILYSSDTTIEAAALSALDALIGTIYPSLQDPPVGLALDIIKECLQTLEAPEKSQAIGATKILASLVRASASAGRFAISQALPQLLRQFNRPALASHRTPILGSITSLLIAARTVYAAPSTTRYQYEEKSLEPFKTSLTDVLRESLRTPTLKSPAVRGSVALIEIPGFCDAGEAEELIKGMDDLLIHDEDPDVKLTVITGLTAVAERHPAIVESITLPVLFHNLPDGPPALTATVSRTRYRSILSSLTDLCVLPALFETLVIRITTRLDLMASPPSENADVEMADSSLPSAEDYRECQVVYAYDLLKCLADVINRKLAQKSLDISKYFYQLIPKLYNLVISAASPSVGASEPLFRDRRLLVIVSRIAETLMSELDASGQSEHLANVYDVMEKGEIGKIVPESSKMRLNGSPLRTAASTPEHNLIYLYSSIWPGLKPDASLPQMSSAAVFLASKVHWVVHIAEDDFQARAGLDLVTAFVNKRPDTNPSVATLLDLDALMASIWVEEVQDTNQPFDIRRRGLFAYMHIVKALALTRNPHAYTAVDRVTDILKLSDLDPKFVDAAARSLSVLADMKSGGKQAKSRLRTKLLHAQKLWNHVLPRLVEGDLEASSEPSDCLSDVLAQFPSGRQRFPYLVAFSSLLPLVSASIYLADLNTILPLLLRSLALPGAEERINAIVALTSILETPNTSTAADVILHSQAPTMIQGLLGSALPGSPGEVQSSGIARSAALHCLAVIPDAIRQDTILSIKSKVLHDLGNALDDPLRSVRREAVECRSKWYTYGTRA